MLDQYTRSEIHSANDLVKAIERHVKNGSLRAGERLPPIRTLATHLDLAQNTVGAAVRRLVDRGVLVTRGRRGTFVAPFPLFAPDHSIPNWAIDLASGNPDPDLLPDLGAALATIDTSHVLYGATSVLPELEEAARRQASKVVAGAPIAVVGGALDGVERALAANLRSGDRVAIEAPGWPAFAQLLRALGLEPVPVEIDDRGILPEPLRQVADTVEAVIITTRVQNPTGAAIDRDRAAELTEVLVAYPDMMVVEDDHAGFISGVPLAPIGPGRHRWALIQSSSKSFGPDLRTAVLFGDRDTVDRLRARQGAGAGWVSHLLQRTLAALLDDVAVMALTEHATQVYDQRRRALIDELSNRGFPATGRTGLNVWIPVPDEHVAVSGLLDAGYAVRAGEWWRMGTPPAIRVTTARLEPHEATEVAEVIATAVRGQQTSVRSA